MSMGAFLGQIQNKLGWIYKYKLPFWRFFRYTVPAWRALIQFYGLMYVKSQSLTLTPQSVMVISPHQDDEVLGCGGLIALKRRQGVPVQVVFITDGAASHQWHPQYQGGEIAPIRHQEALTALAILGVEEHHVHFLDKPDGKLKYLKDADRRQTIAELAQLIRSFKPQEVYVTHRCDRSADHESAYALTQAALSLSGLTADLWQYPIWIFRNASLFIDLKPEELAGAHHLAIGAVLSQKRQAIETYRSQYLPIADSTSTVLPPGFLTRFFAPYELFFKSDSLV
jgi:LmbE family N-acetylglucosaminyl deacetylase